jgi:two-component system sensor histidine kinase YesM
MYASTNEHIESIYIYSEMKKSMITNRYAGPFYLSQDQTWYDYYESIENSEMFVQPRKYNDWYPYLLSLYQPVFINNSKMGVIIINLDIRDLRKVIESNNNDIFEDLYIVDNGDNRILYNKDIDNFQGNFYNVFKDVPLFKENGFVSKNVTINEKQYLISRKELEELDWSVISLLSLNRYEEKSRNIKNFIYLFILINMFIALIITFLISVRTYKPLGDVITLLNEPEREMKFKGKIDKNELLDIYNQIKKSYKSQVFMEYELDKKLKLLNKAQMIALQAQISPHFLSNTLETMKWSAMRLTGGENELSKMALSLSRLLRLTLGAEKSIISIGEELELDKKYIEIMEFRFRDVFRVEWDVNDRLLEYETIQLTLQPIIENAIYHGIRPNRKFGTITVQVREEVSDILFVVTDDGQGIDEETLLKLNRQMQDKYNLEGKHVGVRNVNQRIKLIFGEKYGVNVSSQKNVGTKVTVRIPKYKFGE